MLGGGECWRAGNPGKKRSPGEGGKKFARCASIIPGGAGGVFTRWKNTAFGGIELQKNWAPLGTHATLYLANFGDFFQNGFPSGGGGAWGGTRGSRKVHDRISKVVRDARLLVMSRLKNFNCRRTTVLTVSTETGTPVKSGGPFLPPFA